MVKKKKPNYCIFTLNLGALNEVADWSVFNGVNPNKEFELALACVEQSARAFFFLFFPLLSRKIKIFYLYNEELSWYYWD